MSQSTESTMSIRTGAEKYVEVSERWSGPALLLLRVLLGWHFFFAGITKVLEGNWTAAGYLGGVGEANPFYGFFQAMAGSDWMWLIDLLNMWGLTLVGVALLLGAFVRFSAFWGAVMMWFYWASSLPLANSIFIDDHIIYIVLLFALGAFGAGRYYGLDRYIEDMAVVKNNEWLKIFLG